MDKERLRIGIIGVNVHYGWGRRSHLPALLALPEYELVAVGTAHAESAQESARNYGAPMGFHDYKDMVVHPDIDVVSVNVRVPAHYSIVMAALEAGKHVVCEWPLGKNLAEAEEMASLARSKGVKNMVILQARAEPALLRLRELVQEGYVGEVVSCHMTHFRDGMLQRGMDQPWMARRENGGHALGIPTGHSVDALCFCLGEFKEISARVTTQVRSWEVKGPAKTVDVDAPDNVLISGLLDSGAVAAVHVASVPHHSTGWRLEVYGSEGTIVGTSKDSVQYDGHIRLRGRRGKEGELEDIPIPARLTWVPDEMPRGEPFNIGQLYRRMARAIRGEEDAHPDFDHAVKRHRMLEAIQRSSDLGQKVPVELG